MAILAMPEHGQDARGTKSSRQQRRSGWRQKICNHLNQNRSNGFAIREGSPIPSLLPSINQGKIEHPKQLASRLATENQSFRRVDCSRQSARRSGGPCLRD
jgi:hypothetical protein